MASRSAGNARREQDDDRDANAPASAPSSVLVYSQKRSDVELIRAAAESSGLGTIEAADIDQLGKALANPGLQAAFVDVGSPLMLRQLMKCIEQYPDAKQLLSTNRIHAACDFESGFDESLVGNPLMSNLLLRGAGDPGEIGRHYAKVLQASLSSAPLPLEQLVKNAQALTSKVLVQSKERGPVVEELRDFLLTRGTHVRMATVIATALDELLMNALFDAPVDEGGQRTYFGLSRKTDFTISAAASLKVKWATEGEYVLISVEDCYGSLDQAQILRHLHKTVVGQLRLRDQGPGAGLGLGSIVHIGGSVLFQTRTGHSTFATACFKASERYSDFRKQFRFISTLSFD